MKKREEKVPKKIKERFLELMDIPLDIFSDEYRISMIGKKSILIEKYGAILEYDKNIISISNGISIYGNELSVEEITDNEIFIVGDISEIKFE